MNDLPASNPVQTRRKKSTIFWLIFILLLAAFLRLYLLGSSGVGNQYYAATVQSMLTSAKNFFFGSFEPGGSVTVDKPPVGFWIQAVFATLFGLNGFTLALPQALAGIGSVLLIFFLVKKPFGDTSGLVAAFILATMPITVATERNNTIDGLLVFFLLLAAWVFIRAAEKESLIWFLVGAILVGIGFNIKMLQAYMPLPAFFLVYLVGTQLKWWKRLIHLGITGILILIVSLSWALVVDAIPANQRPYIGSSQTNSVMELILGHNGLSRLFPRGKLLLTSSNDSLLPEYAPPNNQGIRPGNNPQGQPIRPPLYDNPNLYEQYINSSRSGIGNETGDAGWLRLFKEPLATQTSWIFPFLLIGLIPAVYSIRKHWHAQPKILSLILWLGWLIPVMVYFSFTTGLFHTYYLIMLGPPIAALASIGVWAMRQLISQNRWLGLFVVFIGLITTMLFQSIILKPVSALRFPILLIAILLGSVGLVWLFFSKTSIGAKTGILISLLGILCAPITWSFLTVINPNPNTALPRAEPGNLESQLPNNQPGMVDTTNTPLVNFLLENTREDQYLLATTSAQQASPIILTTGRAVFTFGGFTGSDPIIDADGFAEMVLNEEIRYVLVNEQFNRNKPEIFRWVNQHCSVVPLPGPIRNPVNNPPAVKPTDGVLFDCALP